MDNIPWTIVASSALAILGIYLVSPILKRRAYRNRLQSALLDRQTFRRQQLAKYQNQVDDADKGTLALWEEIVSLSLPILTEKLVSEQYTPSQVLGAYQWAALQAQKRTNCICLFIDEAKEQALQLERDFAGKPKPPLYGVPVGVKESLRVKGHDCTNGFVHVLLDPDRIETKDGEYVSWLKSMDRSRTPGGSSGGCAALVACGGALLAIGSDMGGSIRVPSSLCGVPALKPTSSRSTMLGGRNTVREIPGVGTVRGPIARDVDTLIRFYQIYYNERLHMMDLTVAPLAFNEDLCMSDRKLKIGYFYDEKFPPAPSLIRALHEARDIFAKNGHELKNIAPISVFEAEKMFLTAVFADRCKMAEKELDQDIVDPYLVPLHKVMKQMSDFGIKKSRFWKKYFPRWTAPEEEVNASMILTASELQDNYTKILNFRREIVACWRDQGLDAVICPPFGVPAVQHDVTTKLMFTNAYSNVFNVLDFPAGVVRVTTVRHDEERYESPIRTTEAITIDGALKGSAGLPTAVQVVSYPFRDETCLRLMKKIEDEVRRL